MRLGISSFLFPQRCEQTSYATTVVNCSCQHPVTAIIDFTQTPSQNVSFQPDIVSSQICSCDDEKSS